MDVEIVPVSPEQRPVLKQIIELYNYDFSEYDNEDVSEYGFFGNRYLDHYWTENDRHSFFIKVDGKIAGFVLVDSTCCCVTGNGAHSIAEFFVMRKYRKHGIGRIAAILVFNQFPGKWEVRPYEPSPVSHVFWERIIEEYTGGHFAAQEKTNTEWVNICYTFDNFK